MRYRTHGGHCCGYGHVYNFDNATIESLDEAIEEHNRAFAGTNRILEAILSDRQVSPGNDGGRIRPDVIAAGGWAAVLASRGFHLAARWENSNTGRNCYQFLKIDRFHPEEQALPFDWTGPILRPVPPPRVEQEGLREVALRVVSTEYYASLREAGRRGPFDTVAAARQAFPRCARFERREIMSDGTSVWGDVR